MFKGNELVTFGSFGPWLSECSQELQSHVGCQIACSPKSGPNSLVLGDVAALGSRPMEQGKGMDL